ncbi:hypothetical protein GCM10008090_29380 [Arenicella chitinivorans]|uniref:Lipoprotein n=1 Tax=Arenicella chitinivorans TaxID=1329800 RepID=A0A918RYX1_9GAMM|nr:hypothetical protein [Arenicella chitinivorans]GHA17805.1 hypothetical protein GCM10008090_29380 [Arenicella chitinivorans]
MKKNHPILCHVLSSALIVASTLGCVSTTKKSNLSKFHETKCIESLNSSELDISLNLAERKPAIMSSLDRERSNKASKPSWVEHSVSSPIYQFFESGGYLSSSSPINDNLIKIDIRFGVDSRFKVAGMHTSINLLSADEKLPVCTDEIDVIKLIERQDYTDEAKINTDMRNVISTLSFMELAKETLRLLDVYFSGERFTSHITNVEYLRIEYIVTFDERTYRKLEGTINESSTFAHALGKKQRSKVNSGQHLFVIDVNDLDGLISSLNLEVEEIYGESNLTKFSREQQYRNDLIRYNRIRKRN